MPGNPNSQPPQMGMEKRLLLAFALMMIVLLGAQYFFKPAPGPKPHSNITPQKAAQLSEKPVSPPPASAAPAASPVTPLSTKAAQAPAETTQVIDTDLYHIVFSNKGAVIKSWVLKKFRDNSGKPLDLVNVAASGIPLSFLDRHQGPAAFDSIPIRCCMSPRRRRTTWESAFPVLRRQDVDSEIVPLRKKQLPLRHQFRSSGERHPGSARSDLARRIRRSKHPQSLRSAALRALRRGQQQADHKERQRRKERTVLGDRRLHLRRIGRQFFRRCRASRQLAVH